MVMSVSEAARKLGIDKWSLRDELKKPDCPYGYAIKIGSRINYVILPEKLDKWIEENPKKYSNDPNYISKALSEFSTEELIDELKRRGKI